jgi:hypothetical protein
MAHWAELDENNIVIRVVATSNDDSAGDEGYQWLIDKLGGTWVKTSYNTIEGKHQLGGTPFRKNFAGEGFYFDSELDAFIPPKTYPSYILNPTTCSWYPPVPMPSQGFEWNEETLSWVPLESPAPAEDALIFPPAIEVTND